MARVLSFIMAVFIFVPVVAPALGELIILVSHWRGIFIVFILIALAIQLWMYLRLPETLQIENRHPFSLLGIWQSLKMVLGNYQTLGHTISAGLIFGALIGYLTSARQIFQDYFHTGELFVFYFGLSALSVGAASLLNSKIVKLHGMHRISHLALIAMMILSALFLLFIWARPGDTPLVFFMGYAILTFFCMGLLFGNLNAMAMEPMGHLAGIASSVIGAITSALSVIVGTLIGQSYNNSLIPLVSGFLILAAFSLFIQLFLSRINNIKYT
jgi:DHA1 family bicyclomycin/chloramphenicol resistance-like MFS transporter